MALLIRITTDYDEDKTPSQQIDEAMAALGFVRKTGSLREALAPIVEKTGAAVAAFHNPATGETVVVEPPSAVNNGKLYKPTSLKSLGLTSSLEHADEDARAETRGIMNVGLEHVEAKKGFNFGTVDAVVIPTESSTAAVAPVRGPDPDYVHPSGRKFGVAGDGRKRRTKEEMAEDAAYLARLDAQVAANESLPENVYLDANGDVQMKRQEEIPIAEGNDFDLTRDDPIFDATADAQDAADEAAEAETEKPAGGPLTLEDLRRAIGAYAKKHGIPKAQANVPAILGAPMLEVTDFETAIARVKLATATSDGLLHESDVPTALPATKDDLMEAITAYATKYEGKGVKPASGGPTAVDLAEVMRKTFPGTSGALSEIPATPEGYGAALAAVNAAINDNPFSREIKP